MNLYHSYKETVTLLDSEGRSYHIPPNTPWEVPDVRGTDIPGVAGGVAYKTFTIPAQKFAEVLINQGKHYGLVRVMEIRTKDGVKFDVDGAAKASEVARNQAEEAILQAYLKSAKEDELAKLPIKPPSKPIVDILNARGLDLHRDFGIKPVGWTVSEGAKQRDQQMAALEADNKSLRTELGEMKEMLSLLLEEKQGKRS